MNAYSLVKKVYSLETINVYDRVSIVHLFASEESLFTCKDKCICSFINVHIFTSEEGLFTRKNYMLMYKSTFIYY